MLAYEMVYLLQEREIYSTGHMKLFIDGREHTIDPEEGLTVSNVLGWTLTARASQPFNVLDIFRTFA